MATPIAPPVGNGFEIQPAAVSGAAGCFDSEAAALGTAVTTLNQHLATIGACWGTDDVGLRFGTEYQPAAETVLGNIEAISVALARISAALRAVADAHVRGDDDLLVSARAQEAVVTAITPAAVA